MLKTKILLADDETSFLVAIGDFLRDEGFDVVCVEDAEAVLNEGQAMDVLVVDVRLPTSKCEGIEAVGELLRDRRIRASVPIIFISVEAERSAVSLAALSRCKVPNDRYRWLQKPFELSRLANLVLSEQSRLKGKAARQPIRGGV